MAKHGRTVSHELVQPVAAPFDQKMQTDAARAIYQQRAGIGEFPNAGIKCKLGMRRFATRGLGKVNAEELWAALAYNLQRFFKLRAACPASVRKALKGFRSAVQTGQCGPLSNIRAAAGTFLPPLGRHNLPTRTINSFTASVTLTRSTRV